MRNQDAKCDRLIKENKHVIVQSLTNLTPVFIQSLVILGRRSDLEQLLEEETITNFVIEALENLSKAASYESLR